ncbi:MAG: zf-HC2 domain-containing protein [Planctomycetales bacterium]|nr:zf-HC2 domain-containing protein [Planctomycetales bacterium]
MSACREWVDAIHESLDGRLSPEQAAALEAHGAVCAGCRAEAAGLRATDSALRALEPVEPPADLGACVLVALATETAERRRALARAGIGALAAAAAAAFVLADPLGFSIAWAGLWPGGDLELGAGNGALPALPAPVVEGVGRVATILEGAESRARESVGALSAWSAVPAGIPAAAAAGLLVVVNALVARLRGGKPREA